MYLDLNNTRTFVSTGGQWFDASLPTVVFLHGSGLDHRSWALQTRWFAFHGFSVVAPDFPGHSLSAGEPLKDIGSFSGWLWDLLDAMKVKQCSLVGHSQGALVALEAASDQRERVKSLSIVASAGAIPVNEQLLGLAEANKPAAVNAMLNWGFGRVYKGGGSAVPGQAPIGIGARIMNNNPLLEDLRACSLYTNGLDIAAELRIPAQLILAKRDRMTPLKAGKALANRLPDVRSLIELEGVGHMLPIEAPEQCLSALRQFLLSLAEEQL